MSNTMAPSAPSINGGSNHVGNNGTHFANNPISEESDDIASNQAQWEELAVSQGNEGKQNDNGNDGRRENRGYKHKSRSLWQRVKLRTHEQEPDFGGLDRLSETQLYEGSLEPGTEDDEITLTEDFTVSTADIFSLRNEAERCRLQALAAAAAARAAAASPLQSLNPPERASTMSMVPSPLPSTASEARPRATPARLDRLALQRAAASTASPAPLGPPSSLETAIAAGRIDVTPSRGSALRHGPSPAQWRQPVEPTWSPAPPTSGGLGSGWSSDFRLSEGWQARPPRPFEPSDETSQCLTADLHPTLSASLSAPLRRDLAASVMRLRLHELEVEAARKRRAAAAAAGETLPEPPLDEAAWTAAAASRPPSAGNGPGEGAAPGHARFSADVYAAAAAAGARTPTWSDLSDLVQTARPLSSRHARPPRRTRALRARSARRALGIVCRVGP